MFTASDAKGANYVFTALSLVVLLTRAIGSRIRQRPYDLGFVLVVFSIAVVITRIALVHFYLLDGTASDAIDDAGYFNTHDLATIKTGSILSLMARVMLTLTCWLQICLLLIFYSQIMSGIGWVQRMIKVTWVAIGVTFLATVLATFLECRPLKLYWQTSPDPGSCVKGYIQLNIQGSCNIVLDLLLLTISYPILFCKVRSWQQHLRVGALFILGTFCLVVTSVRLALVYDNGSAQPTRSLWASVQVFVSTFVANAPSLYGDLRVAKRKKSEPILRRETAPENWTRTGSDALASVERVGSRATDRSPGKEWFDHLDFIEAAPHRVEPIVK